MNFNFLKKLLPFVGILILFYLLIQIGIEKIIYLIFSADRFFLLLATIFIFPVMFLQTLKWNYLLKKQEINEKFFWLLKTNLIGIFYGMITPSKLGSFIRISYLQNKKAISFKEASLSVVFDRFFDLAGITLLSFVGLLIVFRNMEALFLWIILAFIAFITFSVMFLNKTLKRRFLWFAFGLIYSSKPNKRTETFNLFYFYLSRKKEFFFALFLSLLTWLVIFTQTFFVSLAFGMKIPYLEFVLLMPVGALVAALPITIAGLGTREAVLISLLLPYGAIAAAIVSMSLTSYVLLILLEAFIGFLFSLNQKF